MITITEETFDPFSDEWPALVKVHWDEVALYKEHIQLDLDLEGYRNLEKAGRLCTIAVRDAGKLVGYSLFFVMRHIHYKSTVFGINDMVWLAKCYRGLYGAKLIRESERILKRRGVQKITWHVKLSNGLQRLLEVKGYTLDENVMGKML
jgi:hypothetical protein